MSDQEKIQGVWQLTSGERSGQSFADDIVKNAQLVFEGDKMTTKIKDRSFAYTIKLFPDQSPKAANLDMDGTIGMGIYKLDGDKLTIVHTEAGQDRPKEFATKAGSPLTMMVFTRVNK